MNILKKPVTILFVLAFASVALSFLLYGLQDDIDTSSYIQVINYFTGRPVAQPSFFEYIPNPLFRIIKPLGPMMAAPLALFVGPKTALIFENVLFYLAAAFLMFKIAELIYKDQKKALIAAIFFMTSYAVIRWGLAAYVDMSGWFFFLLSVYLSLLFLESRKESLVLLNGFLSGVGLLFKEPGAVGALFFVAILLLFKFSWRERIRYAVGFAAAFISISLPVSLFIYLKFDFSIYQMFLTEKVLEGRTLLSSGQVFLQAVESIFALMFLGWGLVFLGAYRELKSGVKERLKLWAAFIPSSFFHLVWPLTGIQVRLMFLAAPLLCLLAAGSFEFKSKRSEVLAYIFLAAAVSFNFVFNYMFPKFIYLNQLQQVLDEVFLK